MGVHWSHSAYPSDSGADLTTPVPGGPPGGRFNRWLIPGALMFLLLAMLFGAVMLSHVLPTGDSGPASAPVPASSPAIGDAGTAPAATPSLAPSPGPSSPPSLPPS